MPRFPFPGNVMGTSPGPRSPALPSGAAHAPSGLAAGSPGAAVPIEQGPHATSPKRPADSPNNSTADKNHKATSALPRAVPHRGCPSLSAQPGAVGWMGAGGGAEPGGARSLEPARTWALCLCPASRTSSANDPHKTKQQLFGG